MSVDNVNLESRLEKLQQRKEDLERRIRDEKARVSKESRKKRTRNLIQLGALIEIAGISEADKGLILGVLLEIAAIVKETSNQSRMQKWKQAGDSVLLKREELRKQRTEELKARGEGVKNIGHTNNN